MNSTQQQQAQPVAQQQGSQSTQKGMQMGAAKQSGGTAANDEIAKIAQLGYN